MDHKNHEQIVILHGIGMPKLQMALLAWRMRRAGYAVHNIGYPSRHMPIAELAEHVQCQLEGRLNPARPVHFIGHSMGGLVIRLLLARHRPPQLGRVVMIGTPNQGSEVADALCEHALFRRFYGAAGQQLVTDPAVFTHTLPTVDFPLGVIAGDHSISPLGYFLPGAHDGCVSVERTRVEGMEDHITLPVAHTMQPFSREVARQALAFLRNGRFEHPTKK